MEFDIHRERNSEQVAHAAGRGQGCGHGAGERFRQSRLQRNRRYGEHLGVHGDRGNGQRKSGNVS